MGQNSAKPVGGWAARVPMTTMSDCSAFILSWLASTSASTKTSCTLNGSETSPTPQEKIIRVMEVGMRTITAHP